ncbi:saccharopine dehydrogenase family protein [Pseudochryseolinea flava]|uniref:Saccharopine dehydrogenase n=1 Tax=Pseudochryseolinea flava TaxID=2059302 RepID=A0A364XYR2_9BACT|nr:saccharopine dehydrogenase C-terminal domain-containing protein [Pseudochryseolinea flava]RAV99125.1 saccharopine dehydrogenase [Pseudochryseolinea flava]
MNTILVLGAGRSSSSLIHYLLDEAARRNWKVIVGDTAIAAAQQRIQNHTHGVAIAFDINNQADAASIIANADVVISLLPATLHPLVAAICLASNKHLLTASYVSDEMLAYHEEAKQKGLLFLNECGLDPGIDHMSAIQVIDKIRNSGGKLISFESFTGGLIAPETDRENPWRYKFTWNPRNVVMAGQSTAKYLQHGQFKYIPYQQLFQRTTPVQVSGYGDYEGYANRDSLKYINTYQLNGIETMLRGTLRNKGYCAAWNILVQLGCCDDSYAMENVSEMTHADFMASFTDGVSENVASWLAHRFSVTSNGPELERLNWSGLFSTEPVGLDHGTPAQILEHILNKKWKLNPDDKDLIVMWHRFVYKVGDQVKEIQASLVAKGDDAVFTAMAKTVGLPLGIAATLLLEGKIKSRGVVIPVDKEIYDPVLERLKAFDIVLEEKEM